MIHETFFIRPAGNADISAIKKVIFSVLEEYGLKPAENGKDQDLSDLEKNYFDRGGYFGVVEGESEARIVGTFGLYRINPETCELRKMYLLKTERGRGLGKQMLTAAIAIATEKRYEKLVLETISPLKEAIALYKKYGFQEVTPREINDRVDQAFELLLP